MPQIDIDKRRWYFEMEHMTENLAPANNRRERQRFSKNAPLTVLIGDREIPAYTRDLSNRGVYFYLDLSHSDLIDRDFDFMVKFPPEVTVSTYCSILGRGRLVRKENVSGNLMGIAAKILHYAILRDQRLEFAQPEYAMVN
jgi:hypothetical protein